MGVLTPRAAVSLFPLSFSLQQSVKAEPTAATPASFSALSTSSATSGNGSRSSDSQRELNASKKRALSAAAGDDDEDFNQLDDTPAVKRGKGNNGTSQSAGGGGDPNIVQLGGQKRVEARTFKNMVLIDIREMYTDKTSGEERPGKKGISLKKDQWELLLKHADKINAAIRRLE